MKNFLKQDSLILVLIGITISAFGIMVPILYSPSELGASNIGNSIQFLTLLVGIVTIAYVMKTFQLQRQEIDDNKKDADFNRAIDMVYKQLEQSQRRLEKELGVYDFIRLTKVSASIYPSFYFYGNYSLYQDTLYFVQQEIHLFKIILFNGSLSEDDINKLTAVIYTNFGINFSSAYYYLDRAIEMDDNSLKEELKNVSHISDRVADEFIEKIKPLRFIHKDYQAFIKLNKTLEDIEEFRKKMLLIV